MAIGRPRAFDPDKALDQALTLFWEKGYEGTSLADLTEAIGVNKPSLYAAFGERTAFLQSPRPLPGAARRLRGSIIGAAIGA